METTEQVSAIPEEPPRADGASHAESVLTPPSAEEAERILREVAWEDRLTGYMYHPGPGSSPQELLQVLHVYRLLYGAPEAFHLDFPKLRQWVGDVLGDEELAAEIGILLDTLPDEDDTDITNRVWLSSDPEAQAQARIRANAELEALAVVRTEFKEGVIRLLGERIAQCREVLGIAEEPVMLESSGEKPSEIQEPSDE